VFSFGHLAECLPDRDAVMHFFGGEVFGLPEHGGGGSVVAALDVGAAQVGKHLGAAF